MRRRSGLRPRVPVYLADYATAEDGTGIVHSSPAYGVDDFNSCQRYGLVDKYDEHPEPGAGQRRRTAARLPLFGGLYIWKANDAIIDALRERGALLADREDHAQLSALLAPQDAGDLPRHGAVVRRAWTKARPARSDALKLRDRASDRRLVIPEWGEARLPT